MACAVCGLDKQTSEVQIPRRGDTPSRVELWCCDCFNESVRRRRAERKAQLAARCEVLGCSMRATYTVAGGVGMCGRHLDRVKAEHDRSMGQIGGMGLFMPINYGREELLSMARGGR